MTLAGPGRWAWGYSGHPIALREDDWSEVGQVRVSCPHQTEPGRRKGVWPGRDQGPWKGECLSRTTKTNMSATWDPAGPAGLDCRVRLGRRPLVLCGQQRGHSLGVVVENVGGQGVSARRLTRKALIHRGGGLEGRMTRQRAGRSR